MSERPSQPGEGSVGGTVEGIQTTFSTRELVYPSIIAFLAWVVCVYDYIMFGTLLPKMADDFGWATATSTAIATIVSIGTFFVAIFVGPMIDYFGRKRSLIITTAGTGLSSLLTGLTPGVLSAIYLSVIRAISGLGYSEQAVNTTYLNELYGSRKSRGFIYAFIQGGWPIGVLLASAFTALLLASVGWRGVFMLATIPALIVAALGLRLKESPRFLAMQRVRQLEKEGRHEEAVEFGRHFDIDVHHVQETTLQQIFEPDIRRHTIFLSLAFLTNWIGIQVFAVLGTTVLTEGKGVSFGSALTMYTIGLFFIIGPYAALLFFMGESFPTRVRGTGASFVNAMGPIGAIAGGALLTAFLNLSGENMVLSAFLSGGVATILSGLLMLGTRNVTDPREAELVEGSTAT